MSDGTEIVSDARLFPFRNTFSRGNIKGAKRRRRRDSSTYRKERERESREKTE
jgi:hypothetical protein